MGKFELNTAKENKNNSLRMKLYNIYKQVSEDADDDNIQESLYDKIMSRLGNTSNKSIKHKSSSNSKNLNSKNSNNDSYEETLSENRSAKLYVKKLIKECLREELGRNNLRKLYEYYGEEEIKDAVWEEIQEICDNDPYDEMFDDFRIFDDFCRECGLTDDNAIDELWDYALDYSGDIRH